MGVRVPLYLGHSWWKAEPIPLLSLPYPSLIRKRYPFSAGLTERVFQSPHGVAEPRTHAIRRLSAPKSSCSNHSTRRLSKSLVWLVVLCKKESAPPAYHSLCPFFFSPVKFCQRFLKNLGFWYLVQTLGMTCCINQPSACHSLCLTILSFLTIIFVRFL